MSTQWLLIIMARMRHVRFPRKSENRDLRPHMALVNHGADETCHLVFAQIRLQLIANFQNLYTDDTDFTDKHGKI